MTNKITMVNPIVEIDGDEMTRVIWDLIKKELILPYVNFKTEYYDLGLPNRDKTLDRVTKEAAEAIKKHFVGVKCATITPNEKRVEEYKLKREYKSPNKTIRAMLDGTIFRAPIILDNILTEVSNWKKPIHIGRHAFGDVYENQEIKVTGPGKAELVFTPEKGEQERRIIAEFQGPGIVQGIYNIAESIENFAKSCFFYAYYNEMPVWFSAKDTVSKKYDKMFVEAFEKEYKDNWKGKFEEKGIDYSYYLIDDAVARLIKSEGGMLLALKNYDGDVISDLVASAFGGLALMTSVLVSPYGHFEFEAAHGTVQRHYYRYLKGENTSTNPIATIYAWTGALRKRGEIDGSDDLVNFANNLEKATINTVKGGIMTKDLIGDKEAVGTDEFIYAVKDRLEKLL